MVSRLKSNRYVSKNYMILRVNCHFPGLKYRAPYMKYLILPYESEELKEVSHSFFP